MTRKWKCGRWSVTINHTPRSALWGRFGGGWQWVVGIEMGGHTMILNLLVFSVRLDWKRKEQ